jgi:hypothetical protein
MQEFKKESYAVMGVCSVYRWPSFSVDQSPVETNLLLIYGHHKAINYYHIIRHLRGILSIKTLLYIYQKFNSSEKSIRCGLHSKRHSSQEKS